jgi:hypothetical protein
MKHKIQFPVAVLLWMTVIVSSLNGARASSQPVISLTGTWRFALDAKNQGVAGEWFKTTLPEHLELPGSCEQRGFGVKPEKPAGGRLTHVLEYVGPAWYQREIVIPENWAGKRVQLFLERCHWETTVWVDGEKIGTQNSLCTPHLHDLGRLTPGKHTLTICVDNTYKLKIGAWASAITEETQSNWNGIIGRIELSVTDPVWIRGVQVYPTKLKVSVGNQTGKPVTAEIQSRKFSIPVGGAEVELPFVTKDKPWDEFAPKLHELAITLKAGAFADAKTIDYGIRDFATKDKQFTMNGRPVLMRGAVDECVYPLTGYPPMDKASWLRVLRTCQSYGFNYMRFHSWCPPEAAFAAADELGFLFQIELPLWTMGAPQFGKDEPRDQFIRDEVIRILDTYGNHPSFGFMAMGNESRGSLDTLVQIGRARDPRHLYRCENGNDAAHGDYVETGKRGILGPRTDWNRWMMTPGWIAGGGTATLAQPPVPLLAHEVGQWEMYPNLDAEKKYTGTLRADFLDRYRRSLAAHHLLDEAVKFAEASGKLSVELYKDEIEASLRTWPYGGFQILEARDFPGQGVAIVGWLDAFWDSKGLITPKAFREFCGSTVCLLRMPARVFSTADKFTAQAEISHFGPKDLVVQPDWSIADEHGKILAEGKLPATELPVGRVTSLGEIHAPLSRVTAPARLVVTLRAGDTANRWNIWVYPGVSPTTPADVSVVHEFDQATRELLAAGGRVLLLSSPNEGIIIHKRGFYASESARALPVASPGKNAIPGSFMPTFWNLQLFNQIGTLGILCDPQNPALAEFPTDNHSDWQWADLLGNFSTAKSFTAAGAPDSIGESLKQSAGDVVNRSKAFILNETPADFRPILQVIDNQERNAKLGSVFETRVGPGKLLVCGLDLDTDLAKRPAAQQLRKSLLDYAASDKFAPQSELASELLEKILTNPH